MFRLLICDDHPAIRVGMRSTARASIPRCEVTEAGNAQELMALLAGLQPFDLLVLDVRLPDRSGLELLPEIRALRPKLHIWVTSGEASAQWMTAALNGGANGYLPKTVDEPILAQALRDASQGRIILPGNYAGRVQTDWNAERARSGATQVLDRLGLTPRQRDVLACILRGQSNKQIARALDISDGTVKTHTAAIFSALGVSSRASVIVKCNSLGIPLGGT